MKRTHLPAGVVALGWVSLLMDVSSEMIHALLPVFLVSTLGASALVLGAISGAAEAAVAVTKLFAGAASDWLGRRKPLLLLGYGLAAACKPVFPLANAVSTVFAAHVVDRIGKGIRGAPRDALVADLTPPALRGAAYGLRQAMDTAGACLGPALALVLMHALDGDIRAVFGWAVVPALVCVLVIVFAVREPPRAAAATARGWPITVAAQRRLPPAFWGLLALGAGLYLARLSEAFLLLRGAETGLTPAQAPWVLMTMNVVYAAAAYPLGALADRRSKTQLLGIGLALLIGADACLALADSTALVLSGAALWGLHMACTQGLLAAMVAGRCPPELRGSAFGLFNLAAGIGALGGGLAGGALWMLAGPAAAYAASIGICVLMLLALPRLRQPAVTKDG